VEGFGELFRSLGRSVMGKYRSSGWLTDSVGHRVVGLSQNQTGTVKEARCTHGAVFSLVGGPRVGCGEARSTSI